MDASIVTPPPMKAVISEIPGFCFESFNLYRQYRSIINASPKGDNEKILCVPGYGGSDSTTFAIRKFLNDIGYDAQPAGIGTLIERKSHRIQGVNDAIAFREMMTKKLVDKVDRLYETTGEKITLIGWSLGGVLAFDAASEIPEKTAGVITLGSPFGDIRGTSIYSLLHRIKGNKMDRLNQDFSLWSKKSDSVNLNVPIKIIYSEKDGVVSPSIAKPAIQENIESTLVKSSHIGFVFNGDVFKVIANILVGFSKKNNESSTI